MSQIIRLQQVSKRFGAKVLFENADAHIGTRARIALVGPNGSGKSTLIKMIVGSEYPESGQIVKTKRLAIGYLAQEVPKFGDRTVLEEVMRLGGRREELVAARVELEESFSRDTPSEDDLERYGRVLEELEMLDEYRLESRAKEILSGMGFSPEAMNRPLTTFSGGWLMRVALSRALLMDPDLLLLDEPTNHLDLESLLWLEEFLRAYRGALFLVSHDTEFLNRMVNEVWEIDQTKVNLYRGNLEAWVVQKEERLAVLRAQHAGQVAKMADLERFIERFGAKATKARQAQSRVKQLEKLEEQLVEIPEERATVRFRFPPATHSGKDVVSAKNATFGYGEKVVFRDLDWVIRRGSRVAIVGINGAGKTTLLKLLAGMLHPRSGEVRLGHQVQVGYYAQHQSEALDPKKTILRELEETAPDLPVSRVRGIAGAFLFTGDAVEKYCGVLSGGEKARVALAKLLLSPSNFLLLDEPTNHLDVESRGVLLEALKDYEGTLCLVSHDRAFVSPLVDTVLEIVAGPDGSQVFQLPVNYEAYVERKMREAAESMRLSRLPENAAQSAGGGAAEPSRPTRTGPSNNQKQAWLRERDQLEKRISELEGIQAEIHAKLADEATYADKAGALTLMERQREGDRELAERMDRWEEVCRLLEEAGVN